MKRVVAEELWNTHKLVLTISRANILAPLKQYFHLGMYREGPKRGASRLTHCIPDIKVGINSSDVLFARCCMKTAHLAPICSLRVC